MAASEMSPEKTSINHTPDAKPWHILGAGSIGGLFAAHMSANGADCRLLLKDAQMTAWKNHPGITIQFDNLTFTQTVKVEKLHTAMPIDRLIIATKAQDTLPALQTISHRLTSNTIILLLQNGMGVAEEIREKFPHCPLLHAITSEGVYRPDSKANPFFLIHAGRSKTLAGISAEKPETAREFAQACGPVLNVQIVENIDEHLWRKLAVNTVINPLTALNDCDNGDLAKLPLRMAANQLCDELELFFGHSQKNTLKNIRKDVFDVIHATANNCSSMRADFRAGHKTEIEYITGFLCNEAKKIGVSLPKHTALLELIRLKESGHEITDRSHRDSSNTESL
jgi:2-dehydropantoate 2-reductase